MAEIQYKAKAIEETGAVGISTGDVVKSYTAIPASIQEEVKTAVNPLENDGSRDEQENWP